MCLHCEELPRLLRPLCVIRTKLTTDYRGAPLNVQYPIAAAQYSCPMQLPLDAHDRIATVMWYPRPS